MCEHKDTLAEVICAWANGKTIQYKPYGEVWLEYTFSNNSCLNWNAAGEWRIKPVYPTLAEIAKKAYYNKAGDVYGQGCWKASAKAVAAAIKSGEYSV